MALDVYIALLPSLGKPESEELLPAVGSPIFDALMSEAPFADLRGSYQPPAPGAEPIDLGGAELDDPQGLQILETSETGAEAEAECTLVFPAVTGEDPASQDQSLWLPDTVGPWQNADAA